MWPIAKKLIGFLTFFSMYVLLFRELGKLWYILCRDFHLPYATYDLVTVLPNLIMFIVFLFYRHRTRATRIAEEAERWMMKRSHGEDAALAKKYKTLRRLLLWTPFSSVLIAALFAPELAGMVTHCFRQKTVGLGKYQIQTPLNWVHSKSVGAGGWMITAPGIGRIGLRRYLNDDVPASFIVFYPIEHPEDQITKNVPLQGATILGEQSFALGNKTLHCWDLIHNNPFVGPHPTDPILADVGCSTDSEDFYAHFNG